MNIQRMIKTAALLGTLASANAFAGEVNANAVVEFSSGSVARASEVNGNFSALISAINDNAARIADLESSAPSADVEGHVYRFIEIEVGVEGENGNSEPQSNARNRVFFWSNAGTLSFSGGTVSVAGDQAVEAVVERTNNGVFAETISEVDSPSGTFTQSGSEVAVAIDGDNFTFHVSADGSVMVARVLDIIPAGSVTGADANMIIGVRVQ